MQTANPCVANPSKSVSLQIESDPLPKRLALSQENSINVPKLFFRLGGIDHIHRQDTVTVPSKFDISNHTTALRYQIHPGQIHVVFPKQLLGLQCIAKFAKRDMESEENASKHLRESQIQQLATLVLAIAFITRFRQIRSRNGEIASSLNRWPLGRASQR